QEYALRYGKSGRATILGCRNGQQGQAPAAALANGVAAHAFEQDGARDPSIGTHPGAALLPPVLAACEETNADGKTAICAFIAGCEVLCRIADALHHSEVPPETLGFHAPGITGAFGATVAVARVLGLDEGRTAHAIGIAGSLSSGLLAFTKAEKGGM